MTKRLLLVDLENVHKIDPFAPSLSKGLSLNFRSS